MKGFMICYNRKNEEVSKTNLIKLPLKEEFIIEKSKELYSEDEPCIIYRTAIINKTGLELLRQLETSDKVNVKLTLEELNELIGNILNLPNDVEYVEFY